MDGLLIRFVNKGTLGPIHIGIVQEDVIEVLGAPDEVRVTSEFQDLVYGSLEITSVRGAVTGINLEASESPGGGRAPPNIPHSVMPDWEMPEELMQYARFLAFLEHNGVLWSKRSDLTFDEQMAIRTSGGVTVLFGSDEAWLPDDRTIVFGREVFDSMFVAASPKKRESMGG